MGKRREMERAEMLKGFLKEKHPTKQQNTNIDFILLAFFK